MIERKLAGFQQHGSEKDERASEGDGQRSEVRGIGRISRACIGHEKVWEGFSGT